MTLSISPQINYPESDGQPLADNTIQFRLIVTIQGGIDALFLDNPNVFVAGDLFWYPVEGEPWIRQAPDVMVVMGRPKGDRRSYQQWKEENIPPQVVFEIVSKSNTREELEITKRQFYERYGVEEYYIFNPNKGNLKGWQRQGGVLHPIQIMQGWVSPRLGITFEVVEKELQLYRPDGERFGSFVEIIQQKEWERQRAEEQRQRAEEQRQRAEEQRQRAEEQRQRAERAEQEKEQERLAKQQAQQSQLQAIPKLLAMGLSSEQIAEALSLPVETVRTVISSSQ
ncbi:MAG: Uma2 family endonuclease [Symploca sp. SIO2C1]|nr:Uma2 family endonuclease [Symploca sp. SIO2C1]